MYGYYYPGVAPQTMRGMPGFGGQQQQQQPGRSVSARLPNGKLASNGSGWAFGNGSMPMGGGGGLQNPSRQLGGNVSFAQSLSGSQPSTPLDLSEFPSLSNSSQLGNANASSMWSTAAGARGPGPRNQQATPLSAQAQEDLYTSSSSRAGFRFGNQGQPAQASSNPAEEFPPLNRNANGEIGGERGASLVSPLGFGAQGGLPSSAAANPRAAGNGLLNALSANRATDAPSPGASNPPGLGRPSEEQRKASLGMGGAGDASSGPERRHPSGANETSIAKDKENEPSVLDPLAGMSDIDKFGIKGFNTLMNNYPAYAAMIQGMDPSDLGLNINSPDLISTQVWSPFDDTPPRPAVPTNFKLPECYKVTNVQPIDTKIASFNEETLFMIFYQRTGDIQQLLAAHELHSRNWRWHKKLHIWLTKDDSMTPQSITPSQEQGYYIVWDTTNWTKSRRQMMLYYDELETSLGNRPGV